jgi:cytochrome c-type biogenesis protein CcmH
MNDDIDALRRKLQQLKEAHAAGTLGQVAYDAARQPLERALVDAVTAAPAAPAAAPRPSLRLGLSLGAAVLALAAAGYWRTGAPGLINAVPVAAAPAAGEGGAAEPAPTPAQVTAMVDKLAARLKERPDDAQGWSMLARAYAVLGRTAEALPAYARAVELRPNDASLLADYADTLALQSDRQLNGPPLQLIERALKAEPGNLKALALAGTAAFDRKDFALAVRYWEQLRQGVPADSAYLKQVQAGIDEARQLGKLPASVAVADTAATAASAGYGHHRRGVGRPGEPDRHRVRVRARCRRPAHAAGGAAQAGEGPAVRVQARRQHGDVAGRDDLQRRPRRHRRARQQERRGDGAKR